MGEERIKVSPARLHVLLATEARVGLVIRRGPSNHVATLMWDRRTDKFSLGQWLKGRIYERRSDLSPDGKYLIYFAANHRVGEAMGSWTAISRAPYLKALALFAKGDCWNGGGLWVTHNSYWLNDGNGHKVLEDTGRVTRDRSFRPPEVGNRECLDVYFPRLEKDGWTHVPNEFKEYRSCTAVFEKEIGHGWALRKITRASLQRLPGKGVYRDDHELRNSKSNAILSFPNWEWADLDGKRLVWAEGGSLFGAQMGPDGPQYQKLLHDFNSMKFEAIAAPY